MKNKTYGVLKAAALIGQLAFSFILPPALLAYIGYRLWMCGFIPPYAVIFFILAGIAAGGYSAYKSVSVFYKEKGNPKAQGDKPHGKEK